MNWGSASAFFEVGGYGLYVWGSYGVVALLMLAEPWLVHRRGGRGARGTGRVEPGKNGGS